MIFLNIVLNPHLGRQVLVRCLLWSLQEYHQPLHLAVLRFPTQQDPSAVRKVVDGFMENARKVKGRSG